MQNENKERKEETTILEITNDTFRIPECCREGWPNCPHVLKKERKAKKNIGV